MKKRINYALGDNEKASSEVTNELSKHVSNIQTSYRQKKRESTEWCKKRSCAIQSFKYYKKN